MPAIRATGAKPRHGDESRRRGMTDTRERFGVRRILMVAQVALSLVLLVGALLFVRSLHKLLTLDAGFQENGVLVTAIDFSPLKYPPQRRYEMHREILRRIRLLPGVEQPPRPPSCPLAAVAGTIASSSPAPTPAASSCRNFLLNDSFTFATFGEPARACPRSSKSRPASSGVATFGSSL